MKRIRRRKCIYAIGEPVKVYPDPIDKKFPIHIFVILAIAALMWGKKSIL